MARQEQLFAEAIVGMKKATARRDDASDSDDSVRHATNRGNKLKRKARYAEPGRLDTTGGSRKRRIIYNGYARSILCHNPPRIDADGDVIDQVEDEGSDGELTTAENDPFAEVQVQELLMPLTAAAELKEHPSLGASYTAEVLEHMIQNVQDMLHREQKALWRLKQMTSELRGDQTWMPCGVFETDHDLLTLAQFPAVTSQVPSIIASIPASVTNVEPDSAGPASAVANWDTMSNVRLMGDIEEASLDGAAATEAPHDAYEGSKSLIDHKEGTNGTTDITTKPAEPAISITSDEPINETSAITDLDQNGTMEQTSLQEINDSTAEQNGDPAGALLSPRTSTAKEPGSTMPPDKGGLHDKNANPEPKADADTKMEDADANAEDLIEGTTQPIHRMTTRNQARAAEAPSTPSLHSLPSSPSLSPIHPFFLVPPSVRPDPSVGLAHDEADETRRLLIAYVQRQEEVCRGVGTLYMGLLRAKKMKDDVLEWCSAEGHIGEMSDGEDWVDLEQWGLEVGDLRKGEEVEEEEEPLKGKKTRNRRQVA